MIEFFQDLLHSIQERVRSPILGSISLSLVLWNWDILFVLFFSDIPALLAIWYVKLSYDFNRSFFYPLGTGLLAGIFIPYLSAFGTLTGIRAKLGIFKSEETLKAKKELERMRFEEEKEAFVSERRARLEEEAVDRAAREQRAKEVGPEAVQALNYATNAVNSGIFESDNRSDVIGRWVLQSLSTANGDMSADQLSDTVINRAGSEGGWEIPTVQRALTEVETVLEQLVTRKLVSIGKHLGKYRYALTSEGYFLIDDWRRHGKI